MDCLPATETEIEVAAEVLFSSPAEGALGLFVTADRSGKPHATWMATYAATESCAVITLTSPDSRKVRNLGENPHSEWLFSDADKSTLIYLVCVSEVVQCPQKIKYYWALMGEKDRAYFLNHFNSGMGFAIVLSRVSSVQLVFPREDRKVSIKAAELWKFQTPKV